MLSLTCSDLPSLLDRAYRQFERLIESQDDRLRHYERAVGAEAPDVKRFFDVARATELPGDDKVLQRLRETLLDLVFADLPAIGRYLLPDGPSLSALIGARSDHPMRMTWYPATPTGLVNHPHTDIDLLTLLPPATAPGLEIETEEGWRPSSPTATEVTVLAGEFAQLFGGIAPHRHRVAATPFSRLSVSLFVNAKHDLPIGERTVKSIFDERLAAVADRTGEHVVAAAPR